MKAIKKFDFVPKSEIELEKAIAEFWKLKEETNYQKIRNKFFELFGSFPMPVLFFDRDKVKHLPIFRARPVQQVITLGVQNINSYKGPPKNLNIGANLRANWAGRNVFYGGDSPFCSIVENKIVETKEQYFVGQWEIDIDKIQDDKVAIGFYAFGNLSEDNPWSSLIPSEQDMLDLFCRVLSMEESKLVVKLIQKLSQLFIEDSENYNLSAFLADNILYHGKESSLLPKILIYPSVQTEKSTCNIAFHPDFVDQALRLKKVVKAEIGESSKDEFVSKVFSIGQVELNKVEFYYFNFDRDKSQYTIDKLYCRCGFQIRIKNPDKTMLSNESENLNLKQLVEGEFPKWIKEKDLLSYEEIFKNNGIARGKNLFVTMPLEGFSIDRGGSTHKYLVAECTVRQPFDYIKENNFRFGLKPLTTIGWISNTKSNPIVKSIFDRKLKN